MVSWGFALLLVSVLYPMKSPQAPSPAGRAMARLGQVSYAFYLWHAPVLVAGDSLKRYATMHGVSISLAMLLVLTFGGSLLMAFATTRLIEMPILRWRDRRLSAPFNPPQRESSGTGLVPSYWN